MNRDTRALRGKVVEQYGTIGGFAEAIGWSKRKASYIVTGRQDLTVKEAEACAKLLNIDNAADFMRIFYPQASI